MPPRRDANRFSSAAVRILKSGGCGVIPTDTIYGISARALDQRAVERVYKLRRRDAGKPFIILINSIADLRLLNIRPTLAQKRFLRRYWPGPVSVILACPQKHFAYLHRGRKTLAFRLPADPALRTFLKKTGPLISTSANPAGKPPARSIRAARRYFGAKLDFYADAGRLSGQPSALVRFKNGKIEILREGSIELTA